MLGFNIRAASRTAIVLFALVAAYPSISFLRMDAQELAKAEGNESKIKELQKERLLTAREMAKQYAARFKNREGLVEEVLESTRTLAEAELDVCESDKERVAVLEKILAAAKDNERIAAAFAKSGQGRESAALHARAERLRVEIALERAKARKDGPQKGAANSQPDAKVNKGDRPRVTPRPAAIQAYESVRLFAKVSGVLKQQSVDIGDRVKRGQVLAVVDASDMEAQIKHDHATLDQARARVRLAQARLAGAEADLETAKLQLKQAEEAVKAAAASVRHRVQQLKRMEDLFKINSIEERLLDETKERLAAATGIEQSAQTAVATAKSQALAGTAKIDQAKAAIAIGEAGVVVAQANLEKSQVQLSYATISAPFDGVITQRGYFPGEFIRSADKRDSDAPLFTVERTDRLRVIVSIPDRDVPFIDVGDAAELEFDSLPGKKWSAKVSRMAAALDPKTRSMSIEIDLPNPTGQIRSGMYGKATIGAGARD